MGTVVLVGRRKDERNLPLRTVGAHNSATGILVAVGTCGLDTFTLQRRQQIAEAGSAVHRGLVGRVVLHIVVIDYIGRLEGCIRILARQSYAPQIVENRSIHRAIDQSAHGCPYLQGNERRVGIDGIVAPQGQLDNHARAPGVTAKEPVDERGLHLAITVVAGQFAVEPALGSHGHREIVGAPDGRNSVEKGIVLRPLKHPFEPAAQVAGKLPAHPPIVHPGQMIMPQVDKGIPLIMTGTVGPHPGGHRLEASILDRRLQVGGFARREVELGGRQLHIVGPVALFIDIGRDD